MPLRRWAAKPHAQVVSTWLPALKQIHPASLHPRPALSDGRIAVPPQAQILWQDGFNQVAPFELLATLPALDRQQLAERRRTQVCGAARSTHAFLSLLSAPSRSQHRDAPAALCVMLQPLAPCLPRLSGAAPLEPVPPLVQAQHPPQQMTAAAELLAAV